jgi:hypothetical protein
MFMVYYTVNLYVCAFMTCPHPAVFVTHLQIHGIYVCVYILMLTVFKPVWGIAVGELKYCTCECLFKLMTLEAVYMPVL